MSLVKYSKCSFLALSNAMNRTLRKHPVVFRTKDAAAKVIRSDTFKDAVAIGTGVLVGAIMFNLTFDNKNKD